MNSFEDHVSKHIPYYESKIGNVAVSSNTYDNNNGNLLRTDYANGDYITYTYNDYDNIVEIAGENGTIAQFVYNKKGLIAKCIDTPNNLVTYYYYDFEGNKTGEYRQSTDGSLSYYTSVNSNGNQVEKTSVNGYTKTITSGTDSEGNSFVSCDGVTVDTSSDGFGRTTQVTTSQSNNSGSFTTKYAYADGDGLNSTSHRVETVTQKYGENQLVEYEYEYNENGDVTEVYENGTIIAEYTYDSKNQLLTSAEKDTGLYKYYVYDNGGNLSEVLEYTLNPNNMRYGSFIITHTYSYGDSNWKDKLTAYDNTALTYDANGNPLSYRDGMSFTWVNGRILDTVTVGNTTLSMKYDSNGLRTKKGSIKYYYDSSNNLIGMVNGNNTLLFYYDESGSPTSFSHKGTMYYYIKNLQGDICKLVNTSGSVIANYTYDAWGKLLSVKDANGDCISNSSNVALLNPLRYRGYVYDDETGLYYLQIRYYDPTIGRFLNADILFDTESGSPLSTNMFAYCENNSIYRKDNTGCWLYDLEDYSSYIFAYATTSGIKYLFYRPNIFSLLRDTGIPTYLIIKALLVSNRYKQNMISYNGLSRYEKGDFIYLQSNANFGKFKFGSFRISYNGCGPIALHNVMCHVARPCVFPNILLELEINNGIIPFGIMGTWSYAVEGYLSAHCIRYDKISNIHTIRKKAYDYSAFLFYIRPTALRRHYYCVIRQGKKFFSLNRFENSSNSLEEFSFSTLDSIICVYCIK